MRFLSLAILISGATACYQASRCSAPNGPDIAVQANGVNDPEHSQYRVTVVFQDGQYGGNTWAGIVNHLRCDVIVKLYSPAANGALQCWVVKYKEQCNLDVSIAGLWYRPSCSS